MTSEVLGLLIGAPLGLFSIVVLKRITDGMDDLAGEWGQY